MAKILMVIPPERFRDEELFDTRAVFEAVGHHVVVASTRVGVCPGSRGGRVRVESTLDAQRAADYDAIVFVGGGGSKLLWHNEDALRLAREAVDDGRVVGAICLAPVILGNAGVLEGRDATVAGTEARTIEACGARYAGPGVTVDGNIVTANGPKSSTLFGQRVAELLRLSHFAIRPEASSDVDAIRELNRAAFADHPYSHQTEHLIVDALRTAGALTLSLVAVLDDAVVGHVAFSPAVVGDASTGWYLLGPLAVLPEHQREGIGSMLVKAGIERLQALGAGGCVLVGDAAYYSRFGFRAFPGLVYEGVPGEHVLAVSLGGAAPSGEIRAHDAFLIEATRDDA